MKWPYEGYKRVLKEYDSSEREKGELDLDTLNGRITLGKNYRKDISTLLGEDFNEFLYNEMIKKYIEFGEIFLKN